MTTPADNTNMRKDIRYLVNCKAYGCKQFIELDRYDHKKEHVCKDCNGSVLHRGKLFTYDMELSPSDNEALLSVVGHVLERVSVMESDYRSNNLFLEFSNGQSITLVAQGNGYEVESAEIIIEEGNALKRWA